MKSGRDPRCPQIPKPLGYSNTELACQPVDNPDPRLHRGTTLLKPFQRFRMKGLMVFHHVYPRATHEMAAIPMILGERVTMLGSPRHRERTFNPKKLRSPIKFRLLFLP